MNIIESIRRANEPRAAEDSIRLRVACTGAVLVAISACTALGEISRSLAVVATALISLGMVFSYFTRRRPPGGIKVLVALGAIAALVWFFHEVSAPNADIVSVEDPLTVLLVCIQVVHSFHVPARRDLMFSLGASAGMIAVGAAQAIDLNFGFYVVAWLSFGFWALIESWTSASHGGHVQPGGLGSTLIGVSVLAIAIFLVLPAPTVAVKINSLAQAGIGGPIAIPGALAGDGGSPAKLAQAGNRTGATRIGGYLGFANSLDTALRGTLGHSVVMWVRAQRPSYWVGETFDSWNGQSWIATKSASRLLDQGSPFDLPLPDGNDATGESDLQTFYVADSTANLVFHAESATELWFPSSKVYYSEDGTIVSPIGLGRGTIYSVESTIGAPNPNAQRTTSTSAKLPRAELDLYTQLPHPYPRVAALARSITAHVKGTSARAQALIAWIGAHTHYSTDIPPLPAGADTVDEFLFGNRVGFCEQISTSLAVMLRTLGIPVREAVGYTPGPYNPITDLYEVEADDAHAWVQVWMPGVGWQNFDPTAVVPLANPSPGFATLDDVLHGLERVPILPLAAVLFAVALATGLVRWRRSRPATWVERVVRSLERAGRRAGRPRSPSETLVEYAALLDGLAGHDSNAFGRLATGVEQSVYGKRDVPLEVQRQMVMSARHIRIDRRDRN